MGRIVPHRARPLKRVIAGAWNQKRRSAALTYLNRVDAEPCPQA
jgi:hypothetical protein